MKVLTVYAHPQPRSFCHAVLEDFTAGLREAGHDSRVVDLYAIGFNPVFGRRDFASYVDDSIPPEILTRMALAEQVVDSAGGPVRRMLAARVVRGKSPQQLARLIRGRMPKDVVAQRRAGLPTGDPRRRGGPRRLAGGRGGPGRAVGRPAARDAVDPLPERAP